MAAQVFAPSIADASVTVDEASHVAPGAAVVMRLPLSRVQIGTLAECLHNFERELLFCANIQPKIFGRMFA